MRIWLTVALLSVALAISYIDRTNVAFALASRDFVHYFSLSDAQRGALNSAFFWTYGFLQIPAGALVDKYGPKWPIAGSLVVWCIAGAACGLADSFLVLMACRLGLGLAESMITPGGLRWIRDNVSERHRGFATGLFFSGAKWGPAIGAPIATWLIQSYSWRVMFFGLGLGGLVWLLPWVVVARDRRSVVAVESGPPFPLRALFTERVMWGTLIGTFCYNYFAFYAVTWLPAYFVEQRHFPLTTMGFITGFSYLGMATVAILAGLAADWFIAQGGHPVNVRRGFTITGLLVASTEVIGALTSSDQTAAIFSVISMAGLGLATANYWSLPQTVMPAAAAGRVGGAQNVALTAAGIVAPLLTAWLKQISGGYTVPMLVMGAILLAGVSAYVFLVPVRR